MSVLQNAPSDLKTAVEWKAEYDRLKKEFDDLKLMYDMVVKHATMLENDLEKRLRDITYLSTRDTLTGIYNRRKFNESLVVEIDRARVRGVPLSLIIYDIDDFKGLNDNFGHDYGDYVILSIVNIVREFLGEQDVFARWGGDEFTILMPGKEADVAYKIVEDARKKIYSDFFGIKGVITCSFGITELADSDDIKSFVVRADGALYDAKKSGRNRADIVRK